MRAPKSAVRQLACVGLAGFIVALPGACSRNSELPQYGTLPPFSLQTQDTKRFTRESLEGNIWIVSFIFTSCRTVCPRLTSRVHQLQTRLTGRDAVRLLSISVDPETDTPRRLREYAQKKNADLRRWTFVTGQPQDIARVTREGFKLALGARKLQANGSYDIMHSTRLVLVDSRGTLRGFYRSDKQGLDDVLEDARTLARAK